MQISIIPEEKIRQAFDLFLSLRNLNLAIPEEKREFDYRFEADEYSIDLWVFYHQEGDVAKYIHAWRYDPENKIDELIDMIEEELDAARSRRDESSRG